jgi:hypothetical protein
MGDSINTSWAVKPVPELMESELSGLGHMLEVGTGDMRPSVNQEC